MCESDEGCKKNYMRIQAEWKIAVAVASVPLSPYFDNNEKKQRWLPYMKIFHNNKDTRSQEKKSRVGKTQFFHMLAAPLQIPN